MKLPALLKKRIATNFLIATIAILLFFIMIFCFSDVVLALPCLILSVLLIVKTAILFYNCIAGNYLEIKGVCSEVEKTPFRRRVKSITVKAEDKKLKLNAHCSIKNIGIGDAITVYISQKSPLYYKNGTYVANEFYGVSVVEEE